MCGPMQMPMPTVSSLGRGSREPQLGDRIFLQLPPVLLGVQPGAPRAGHAKWVDELGNGNTRDKNKQIIYKT